MENYINVWETIGSMQYMHIFYTQGCNLNQGIKHNPMFMIKIIF